MMSNSTQRRATAEEVQRDASLYILQHLGDRLRAGIPIYDEHYKRWKVPIHSRSLPAEVELGHILLNAYGVVVNAPSRKTVKRTFDQL